MLPPIALALGGEAAARLLPALGLAASPSALLRLICKTPDPAVPTPRVLGVDDWVLRRGHVYGAILVDLERQRIVDLLPDRTVETLADWFKNHPGVEIVSRDRSGSYPAVASAVLPLSTRARRWNSASPPWPCCSMASTLVDAPARTPATQARFTRRQATAPYAGGCGCLLRLTCTTTVGANTP